MSTGRKTDDSARVPPSGTGEAKRPRSIPRGEGVGWFGTAALVNAIGTGFFYPYQLLFFVAVTDLSLTTVGAGLTAATLIALPAVFMVGRLVQRWGPRTVLIVAALVRAGVFVGYLFIHHIATFIALAVVAAVAQRAEQISMPVLAAGTAPAEEVGLWLALTRVSFNLGMGFGGLLAGFVFVGVDDGSGYTVMGLLNAASFALAALLYLPLAAVRPASSQKTGRTGGPWRDGLFLRLALANFALITVIVATEVGLPVYLIEELRAPSWTVGLVFAVNTVLMVLFQLPITGRVEGRAPLRVIALGSVLHAALLAVLGLAGVLSFAALLPLLLLGVSIYTLGEILATQALSVLLVKLAPEREIGVYQAFNQVLVGLSLAIVPLLVAFLLTHTAAGLWWLLTAMTVALSLGMLSLHRTSATAIAGATPAPSGS
ncbi:MFS transporter [Streptomyces wedmorensis]|uniref:MFS transporter n=1 Tax=Streptomyces TaxID=1883 RepID=UPI0006914E3E|nr:MULTISPECIES: MFS transporter [Streptomyces]